jgi:hypothetical protein
VRGPVERSRGKRHKKIVRGCTQEKAQLRTTQILPIQLPSIDYGSVTETIALTLGGHLWRIVILRCSMIALCSTGATRAIVALDAWTGRGHELTRARKGADQRIGNQQEADGTSAHGLNS